MIYRRFLYEVAGLVMEENTPINFIFFTSSLLRDLPSSETEPTGDLQNIRVIPWKQWADHTRVTIWKPPARVFTICVSGTRFVRRIPGNAPNHYKIQICDFNKYALANQDTITNLASPVCTTRYVHSSRDNILKNTILFNEPLYTRLPYLEITTRSSFKLRDVMIDHDNIYLIRVSVVSMPYASADSFRILERREKWRSSHSDLLCGDMYSITRSMPNQFNRCESTMQDNHECKSIKKQKQQYPRINVSANSTGQQNECQGPTKAVLNSTFTLFPFVSTLRRIGYRIHLCRRLRGGRRLELRRHGWHRL